MFKQAMDDRASPSSPGVERFSAHPNAGPEQETGLAGQTGADGATTSSPAARSDTGQAGAAALGRQAGQSGDVAAPPTSPDSPAPGENDTEAKLRKDEVGLDSGADVQQDLQQLLAEQMMRSQTASMQRAEISAAETISPQLVSDVAQRILVSAGKEGHDKEVRIQIKDSLLQDTEVFIARRQGELQITFVTQSPSDTAILTRSRDAIATSLEQALDGSVKVNVEADTDSRDRHSRGEYIEQEEV